MGQSLKSSKNHYLANILVYGIAGVYILYSAAHEFTFIQPFSLLKIFISLFLVPVGASLISDTVKNASYFIRYK